MEIDCEQEEASISDWEAGMKSSRRTDLRSTR